MKNPVNAAFNALAELHLAGLINPFTYVLGCHVLHRMQQNNVRQIMLSARDLGCTILVGSDGRIVAGAVEDTIHQQEGAQVYSANDVSPRYIIALKQLHFSGILLNDVRESGLNLPGAADHHFSGDPCFSPGTHWTEATPIVYRLLEEVCLGATTLATSLWAVEEGRNHDRTMINAA